MVFISSSISVVLQLAFSVAVILLAVIVIARFVRQRRFKNLAFLLAGTTAATAILSLLGTAWYAAIGSGLIVVALAAKWFRERRPPQSR